MTKDGSIKRNASRFIKATEKPINQLHGLVFADSPAVDLTQIGTLVLTLQKQTSRYLGKRVNVSFCGPAPSSAEALADLKFFEKVVDQAKLNA